MTNILSDIYFNKQHLQQMPSETPTTTTTQTSQGKYHPHLSNVSGGGSDATATSNNKKLSEDAVIDILRSNNIKQQNEILEELMHRIQQQNDSIIYLQKFDEILNIIRSLILNTLNIDLQINCLKFILILIKTIERLKLRHQQPIQQLNQLDQYLLQFIMPSIVPLCASIKLQLRQLSIDSIQLYMKITNNLPQLFTQFIRYGVENSDLLTSKGFIESLYSLLTDEYKYEDYTDLVKSLVKHSVEQTLEKSCMKILKRIEQIVRDDVYNDYLKKLSPNLKNFYLNLKRKDNANVSGAPPVTPRTTVQQQSQQIFEQNYQDDFIDDSGDEFLVDDVDEVSEQNNGENLKFNIISNKILKKLFGEDEMQRLNAIEQLNVYIKNLDNISSVYPYYEDFIIFIGNFIDDSNYKVRVGALEILFNFVKKLKTFIETCYKVICNCARQVMSQTHQSKIMKQLIMNIMLLSIENIKNPNLIIESLLDRIKDKSAKAREECLNIVIAALIKYGSYKFDLIFMFKRIFPLLFDIKRNVRLTALECVAVLFHKLKEKDRDIDTLFDLLDYHIDAHNLEAIKTIIKYRLNRNKFAKLNQDMTIEYGIKIPAMNTSYGQQISEPDIDWIISASASASNSAAILTHSARQLLLNNDTDDQQVSQQQFIMKRKSSGTKRLPWEDQPQQLQNIPKVLKSREVAPLKAFPLVNDNIDVNSINSSWSFKPNYTPVTSYQEKFLKRMNQQPQPVVAQTVRDSPSNTSIDLQDITNYQSKGEKSHSLDSLNGLNYDPYKKPANVLNSQPLIPSKPTLARRNSGTHLPLALDDFSNDDQEPIDQSRKYYTVQLTRTSAKNRKKLDRLFSINTQQQTAQNENTTRTSISEPTTVRSHKTSDQYSESGVFTLSEYDQSIRNSERTNANISSTSDYSATTIDPTPFTKPKLLRTNSKPKLHQPLQLPQPHHQQQQPPSPILHKHGEIVQTTKQQAPLTVPVATRVSNVEVVGKKLVNTSLYTPTIFSQHPTPTTQTPLSHNSQQTPTATTPTLNDNNNAKKRANALRNLNDASSQSFYQAHNSPSNTNLNNEDENMLDIVGKGLLQHEQNDIYQQYQQQLQQQEAAASVPPEDDIPMSQSLQSRLKQKTLEKIEEKQRKKSNKQQKRGSYGEIAVTPTLLTETDFGLSISGYNSGTSIATVTTTTSTATTVQPNRQQQQQLQQQQQQVQVEQVISLGDTVPTVNSTLTSRLNQKDFDDMPVGGRGAHASTYYNFEDGGASDINITSSYASSANFMLPTLEPQIKHRPPINRLDSNEKKTFPPKSVAAVRAKPVLRSQVSSKNEQQQATTPSSSSLQSHPPQLQHQTSKKPSAKAISEEEDSDMGFYGQVKEDFVKQPFKNADAAYKDAMTYLAQDEWEKKCHAMNVIRRLSAYHDELVVANLHPIVVALLQEVKNLRSQVSRFALTTFADLFANQRKYMDIDLDIAVKTILNKNGESSDFIRADVERCLSMMINNVTTHKALAALITGGAGHRSPLVRKTAAQFIYKACELMGPGKILSGIKDVTERVLVTASQFVVDGPPDIRWYGRKIFHILMSYDEFDRMLQKYVSEKTRKNIKEILDSIRVKGPGEVPTESARLSRKGMRATLDPISKSAGVNVNMPPSSVSHANTTGVKHDSQTQEDIKEMCTQMRNTDFRERIDAIEKFQILCETETDTAISNIVPIFDKFNLCLNDSNSKVNYKALNTMFQITPILADGLSAIIPNVVPLLAQNLASKNTEIQDLASQILDLFIEYLDGGVLIQPFASLAQHGNARVKPVLVTKLADLIPHVYTRKQKQIELHVLPAVWGLLNLVKGNSSTNGSGTLNSSVTKLIQNLYEHMGDTLFERAANNSNVPAKNLELLQDLAFRTV